MIIFKSLTNKFKNCKFNEGKKELINEIYILYICNIHIIGDQKTYQKTILSCIKDIKKCIILILVISINTN